MTRREVIERRTALDWRLFAEAAVTLIICRIRLRRRNFAETRAWAAANGRQFRKAPVRRLVWSIEAAAKRMNGATCLCKALALQRMLTRGGYGSELRIGVSKSEDKLIAHAWLIHDGYVLVGGAEAGSFTLLAAWDGGNGLELRQNEGRGKR